MRAARTVVGWSVFAVLSACGGGGSTGPNTDPTFLEDNAPPPAMVDDGSVVDEGPEVDDPPPSSPSPSTPPPSSDGGVTAPPQPQGRTLWMRPLAKSVVSVAGAPSGSFYALESGGAIARWSSAGAMEWQRALGADHIVYGPLTRSPRTGALFISGAFAANDWSPPYAVMIRTSPEATDATHADMGTDETRFGAYHVHESGFTLTQREQSFSSMLTMKTTDGAVVWSLRAIYEGGTAQPNDRVAQMYFAGYGFDPAGDVVVAGSTFAPFTIDGRTFGAASPSLAILKFNQSGALVWSQEIAGIGAHVSGLEFSAKGTVVLSGHFTGNATWAGTALSASAPHEAGFLMVLESDGRPRWVKQLPAVRRDFDVATVERFVYPSLAVDPAGAVTVILTRASQCDGASVVHYNLAGARLWQRDFKPVDCKGHVYLRSVEFTGPQVVVGGEWLGTVDFGNGRVESGAGVAGMLLQLEK